MFKKKFKVASENQLSGKDKKILKANLAKVVPAEAAEHFVNKSERIIAKKLHGSKTVIYF